MELIVNNIRENERELRMDNPKALATMGTKDRERRQTIKKHNTET
jgi:hypothetical protein